MHTTFKCNLFYGFSFPGRRRNGDHRCSGDRGERKLFPLDYGTIFTRKKKLG